ncbi:MAG: hypothetical protein GEV12_16380 [Micromonosporaceae bacterium]|nr:hypothetical protein [Micromonosporaceae bacterium]
MRVINRLASLLLGLALLAGGLLAAVEAVLVWLDRAPLLIDRQGWYDTLTTTRFSDNGFLVVAIVVGLAGLLLLVLQLRRWRPTRLSVPAAQGWHVQRRSAERLLAGVAGGASGVSTARVRLRERRGDWRPFVTAVGDPSARPQVEAAVRDEVARLAGRSNGVNVTVVQKRRVS